MSEAGPIEEGRAEKKMSQREINEGMALLQNMLMEGNISQETMLQVRDSFQDIAIASHGRKGGRGERGQSEAHPLYSLGRHLARPQRTCTRGLVHVHNACEKYVDKRGKSFVIVGGGVIPP